MSTITFFERITTNSEHVLQPFLPEKPDLSYNLRERTRNRSLITKTLDVAVRLINAVGGYRCRLISQFLQCQDRLVRSACGSSLADFILAVSIENHIHLATDSELQQQHCRTDTIIMNDHSASNSGLSRLHLNTACLSLNYY